MPDIVEVNDEQGIIEIRSFGQVSREDIADSFTKVQTILKERGIDKILVDTTGQEFLPDVSELLPLFGYFPRGFCLALLATPGQKTDTYVGFIRAVTSVQGVEAEIFYGKDEAVAWLTKSRG